MELAWISSAQYLDSNKNVPGVLLCMEMVIDLRYSLSC